MISSTVVSKRMGHNEGWVLELLVVDMALHAHGKNVRKRRGGLANCRWMAGRAPWLKERKEGSEVRGGESRGHSGLILLLKERC